MQFVFVVLEHFQQIFFRHRKALEFLLRSNYLPCNRLEGLLITSLDGDVCSVTARAANLVKEAILRHCTKTE